MKYLFPVFIFFTGSLMAQNKTQYTLKECIEYAYLNNVTIKQAEVTVENSELTVKQSKAQLLPAITGFSSLSENVGRNVDPFTNGVVTQTIGTNNLGLSLNLPVYQGNRLRNTVDRDKLSLQASQQDVITQKNNIALQVTVAYLNVLSAEDMIEVARSQLEVTRLQFEKTQKLVDAGAMAETNLYDLESQRANDELSLINAENSLQSAILALKRNMNAPVELFFDIVRQEVPNPSLLTVKESAAAIYATALGFLPEINAGKIRLRAADRNIAIAKASGLPTLSFSSNWGTAYSSVAKRAGEMITSSQPLNVSAEFQGQTIPFVINFPQTSYAMENIPYFSQLGTNQNMSFGLSLNVPIFNRFTSKHQTQAASIQKKQVNLQNQAAEIQVKQSIDQAYLDMLNAKKKYDATLVQSQALEKSYVAAEKRYSAGAATFVDYNLAKTNYDRSKTNLIVAKYDYIFRIKILDFYQNKPLEF